MALADNPRATAGRKTRSEVLGEAYVAASDARRSDFNADFLDFITEGAWGSVWSRPGLTRRERSMITIALLAAGGHFEEVAMHVRATANTGASPEDIKEALLHVAVYAGVPAANQAFKVAKQTLDEMGGDEMGGDQSKTEGKQETRK
jgi:4-carboxymuconolactone decarboxylase